MLQLQGANTVEQVPTNCPPCICANGAQQQYPDDPQRMGQPPGPQVQCNAALQWLILIRCNTQSHRLSIRHSRNGGSSQQDPLPLPHALLNQQYAEPMHNTMLIHPLTRKSCKSFANSCGTPSTTHPSPCNTPYSTPPYMCKGPQVVFSWCTGGQGP